MRFKERVIDGVGFVTLKGNLMGHPETTKLVDEVKAMLRTDVKKVVLDLHGVKWVNSIGVGAIIKSYGAVNDVQGSFGLANISDKINSLLVMTKLNNTFKVYETIDEAIIDLKN